MSIIRGVLLAGRFRTQHDLDRMTHDDMRNTLIVELAGRSRQTGLQGFDDARLAGFGAVLVTLRTGRIRDDAALKGMTADDMRNILIVELGGQTGMSGSALQAMSDLDLVLLALGRGQPGSLTPGSFIRGVLLAGQFRTQHELDRMSADDMRNTLIVEMAGHSNQNDYQAFNDFALAGAGAAMVLLRGAGIRTDAQLKAMSADDQRNVLIVEVGSQTGLGARLQGLSNMDLVLAALGVDPVFSTPRPHTYAFSVDSFECQVQRSDNDHSDSDWLTLVVAVIDPVTKSATVIPAEPIQIGGSIHHGDNMRGPFISAPFQVPDGNAVSVSCLIVNLGSSDAEDQFAQAVKVTNKVVDAVAPIAGTIAGFIFGDPAQGFQIGSQIAAGFDVVVKGLGEAFDFIGVHFGPPNCNGEVVKDTLLYQPGEWVRAVGQPAQKQYTAPAGSDRCGSPAQSLLRFSAQRFPAGSLFGSEG